MSPILEARAISVEIGKSKVLRDVTFSLQRREVVAVLGESGCGKTTFLRCLNFLQTLSAGSICYDGQVVAEVRKSANQSRKCDANDTVYHIAKETHRRRFGVVFQAFNLFPNMTVLGNVIEGPIHVLKKTRKVAEAEARRYLNTVGMADRSDAYPDELSGGERQRVAIARALAMEPNVLLLDEITSSLDPPRAASILNLIERLRIESGTSMVVVTHHIDFATRIADRVCYMHGGTIVENGPPTQVLSGPKTDELKNFLCGIRATR